MNKPIFQNWKQYQKTKAKLEKMGFEEYCPGWFSKLLLEGLPEIIVEVKENGSPVDCFVRLPYRELKTESELNNYITAFKESKKIRKKLKLQDS